MQGKLLYNNQISFVLKVNFKVFVLSQYWRVIFLISTDILYRLRCLDFTLLTLYDTIKGFIHYCSPRLANKSIILLLSSSNVLNIKIRIAVL